MADLFKTFTQHVGHKVPLHPDEFVWRQDTAGKEAMAEARGAMHEASQDTYYADGGALNSMFEKLSYFWTHEGRTERNGLGVEPCFVFCKVDWLRQGSCKHVCLKKRMYSSLGRSSHNLMPRSYRVHVGEAPVQWRCPHHPSARE